MMNLYDLKEIAKRQQEHIETHQRLIMAKEQRLKYLKQQSSSHQLHEQEKKRQRLKESISLQEMKLRRLKALRGQFHLLQAANTSSTTELESIRALFSEKEKELSVALAKVDALTRQLEELKNGNTTNSYHINGTITDSGKHNLELEKLRQELLYRNKLCETHSTEILQERNRVMRKQIELSSIDQRINELQQRLERKRLLNQQLSSQMHNNFTRSDIHPLIDNALYNNNHLLRSSVGPTIDRKIRPVSANIAAVEPLQRQQFESSKTEGRTHAYRDFAAAKQDPKYQTLPHNTKFGAKQSSQWSSHGNSSPSNESYENRKDELRYSFKYNESNRFVPDTSSNGSENKLAGKPFFEGPSSSDSSSPELSGNATHKDAFATRESYTSKDNWKAPPDNQTPGASHNGYQGQSQAGHHSFNKEISSGQSVQPTTSQYLQASDSIVPNNQSYNDISSTNVSNRHSSLNFTNSVSNYKPVLPPKPSLSVKPVPPPRQTPNASNTGQAELDSSKTNDAVDNAISLLKGGSSFENGSVTGSSHYPRFKSRLLYYRMILRYSSPPAYSDCSVRHGFVSKSVQQLQGGKSSKQCSSLEQCEIESSSKDTSESITDSKNIENYERNPGEENLFNKTYKDSGYNDMLSTKPVADESKLGIHNIEASSIVHEQDDWHKSKRRPVVVGGEMEHALEAEIINGLDDISPVDDKPSISEMVHSVDVDSIDKALDASDFRQKEISPSSAECIQAEQENSSQVVSREDSNSEMSQMEASTTKTIDIGQASAVGGVRRTKSNLKNKQKTGERVTRRVSFDPLALLLDAALEGELELVKKTAPEVSNPSSANDEGITALHNAICARHFDVVKYLIEIGCDVNLPDSDGWTPLHCAASCNSLAMVKFLVEHGACIFATTISDHETAPEKCEEDEDGYEECTQYLYGVQEKLGILNGGAVYAVYDYDAQNPDELSFKDGDRIIVLRKGDDQEREWWWSKLKDKEGYVPRNLIGLYPRIRANREQLSNPSSSMEAELEA